MGSFFVFLPWREKLIFVVDDIRFIHIGADRDRVIQVEYTVKRFSPVESFPAKRRFRDCHRRVFPDKVLYGFIFRKDHAFLFLMAGKETVKGNDNREIHFSASFKAIRLKS